MLSRSAADKHDHHLFPMASLLDNLQERVSPQTADTPDCQHPQIGKDTILYYPRILKDSKMQQTKVTGEKINNPYGKRKQAVLDF